MPDAMSARKQTFSSWHASTTTACQFELSMTANQSVIGDRQFVISDDSSGDHAMRIYVAL